jgi:hypothetical protein
MTLLTQKLKENNRKVHIETLHIRLQELGIDLFVSKENKLPTKPFMIMRMS